MNDSRRLTVCDKLLVAAYRLQSDEDTVFTAEDLVISAWRHFPRTFGLRGYNDEKGSPLHPDSNRVFAEIMGAKPIRKRGFLVKVGQKLYKLTPSGREAASRLEAREPQDASATGLGRNKASLSRDVLGRLERLLGTRAVEKSVNGQMDRMTFHDACLFWGISSGSSSIELEGALSEVDSVISYTEEAVKGGATELRTGGPPLTSSTTQILNSLHQELQERFNDELATIRARPDER